MPLFDYKCEKCSHVHEELVSHNFEDIFVICPLCSSRCDRLFSRDTTFILVGHGWASEGYSSHEKKTQHGTSGEA